MKDKINILIVFIVIIISRLPFIWNSPGADPDNWLVLATGKDIAETGIYRASRLPGYPISEYLAAFFGKNAWLVLNFISVFSTSLSCIVFYKILEHFKVKDKFLASLSLSFVPAIFIASTVNMEYTWSLFFLLFGLLLLIKQNFILAGIAFGLMISTRFTNIIFLLPIIYFLYYVIKIKSIKNYILFFGSTVLIFIIIFIPVFSKYSLNLFPDVGEDQVSFKTIFSQYTLHIYGLLGLSGLIISIIYLMKNYETTKQNFIYNKEIIVFSGIMVLTTTLFYIKFPYESYYNIPLLPFLVLILALLVNNEKVKRIVFASFILSPFLLYLNSTKIQIEGPIFTNEQLENDIFEYTKNVHKTFSEIPDNKKLLVTGGFYYCYHYKYPNKNKKIKIYKRPTEELLKYYKSIGYSIYYPDQIKDEISNLQHYDISKYGLSISSISF